LSFSKSDIDQGRVFLGDGNQIILENKKLKHKFNSLNEQFRECAKICVNR